MKRQVMMFSLIGVGVLCMVVGALRGEVDTVFAKAIRICLECIGIG
ncbi:MAG: CD1871A family CXXC motif-containing protein [Peptoniphilus sp.]|nr:CD1871A family CXXC motif-containing protein [Peptoniphilus sp.]MDD7362636.1 CD1871A family CXXC motif-containing protein [Bacillota bacterium]MDY6044965.1 CD1871A family CXXC motif-containing protein [Peptoniphilus sp.]